MVDFVELNGDQRREMVNTRQRYQAWRNAVDREYGYRGSMVWETTRGHGYLLRSFYEDNGRRRQKSLGRRSPDTERIKQAFDAERQEAVAARTTADAVQERQAAINRALGLGRVPLLAARILRLLDKHGWLGHGMRVVGTNALYCYEAACGVLVSPEITTTGDIDLLFDARSSLRLIGNPDTADGGLLQVLRLADKSFKRTRQSFRAQNDEGYLVDLIKPQTNPPWRKSRSAIGGADDMQAAEIEGLKWLENAPSFEQIAIDEKGVPLRMVSIDPRVFAVHKLWLSRRQERDPVKKSRDRQQAMVTAALTKLHLQQLPFEASELRMLPRDVLDEALVAFSA